MQDRLLSVLLTLPFGYNISYMFVKNYQVGGKKGASSIINFFLNKKKKNKKKKAHSYKEPKPNQKQILLIQGKPKKIPHI